MRVEAFTEGACGHDGFIRRIDTRVKLAFAVSCLLLSVVSSGPAAPVATGLICLGLILASGGSPRSIFIRLSEPMVFACILAVFQTFLTRGDAVYSLAVFGKTLAVSGPGLHKGTLIMARVFGAVSTVLFLTMTSTVHRLLSAAAWFRMPRGLVELLMLTYRYIFVLMEDASTVYHAQRNRLGYIGIRRSITSLGTLCGTVFLRAYSQAEATGASMTLRGYTGGYIPACRETFRPGDAVFMSSVFSVCLAVLIWTR